MNKNLIPLAIIAIAATMPSFMPDGGNCQPYYPVTKGSVREMKNYKAGDKLTGRVVQTVTDAATNGNTFTITASSQSFDDKDNQVGSVDFTAKCDTGGFSFNMASMYSPDPAASKNKMSVKVTGDNLDMPINPSSGQQLKGGTMNVSMTMDNMPNMTPMNMVTTISNRKVDSASVSVTTPAGQYNCVKISYDITTKMMFTSTLHVKEWYAKNVGLVRSERYTDKGKLEGYSVLTSLKSN